MTLRFRPGTVRPVAELREEQRGPARWLILDRPAQRNALTPGLIAGLQISLARADADAQARVICLTGSGDKAFCSGMDLGSFAAAFEAGAVAADEARRGYAALLSEFTRLGKPVLAVVNGAALAGGLGLLAACDLAVAADDARFGAPEVDVGPTALRLGRRAFYATQDMPYEQQLEALGAQFSLAMSSEDAAEGVAAFLESRKADFKGR